MKPSRPVAELEAFLAAAKPVCRIAVQLGSRETICSPPALLVAELGRAKRRAELEGRIEKTTAELVRIEPPRVANSDALALVTYLAALGIVLGPDTANKLLSLLAVLVIECGGGLALAVGLSLSERTEQHVSKKVFAEDAIPRASVFTTNAANSNRDGVRTRPERPANTADVAAARDCSRSAVGHRLVEALRERGGPLQTSIRRFAARLGTTPTTLHTVARELIAAGVVAVDAGRQGSVFRLLVPTTARH